MCTNWWNEVQNKPKLRTYMLFKSSFGTEDYVNSYLTKYQRSLFAQLRCGVLPIQVEVGRFSNTPLEMRICKLCNQECEDEIHFICVCPRYEQERNELFQQVGTGDPTFMLKNSQGQFVCLMTNYQYRLAKYLSVVWQKRKRFLYVNAI